MVPNILQFDTEYCEQWCWIFHSLILTRLATGVPNILHFDTHWMLRTRVPNTVSYILILAACCEHGCRISYSLILTVANKGAKYCTVWYWLLGTGVPNIVQFDTHSPINSTPEHFQLAERIEWQNGAPTIFPTTITLNHLWLLRLQWIHYIY